MGFKRITITIDKELLNKFKLYCKKNGMKISTRIQTLIKKDME